MRVPRRGVSARDRLRAPGAISRSSRERGSLVRPPMCKCSPNTPEERERRNPCGLNLPLAGLAVGPVAERSRSLTPLTLQMGKAEKIRSFRHESQ
jgi:hypothetical protein